MRHKKLFECNLNKPIVKKAILNTLSKSLLKDFDNVKNLSTEEVYKKSKITNDILRSENTLLKEAHIHLQYAKILVRINEKL